jgi:tRNA dimethylallyltransferase
MQRPILILGPTAGGKSELAAALAESLARAGSGAEIISADSMQVYRGMDAGTAKPPEVFRRRAAHHLIDIVEPGERFTVADWLERTERLLAEMAERGARAIIVGGTNLYIQAFLEGLFAGPGQDGELRAALGKLENEQLHERLLAVDAAAAERIHRNDRKKMIRAIEVYELTGQAMSQWQKQWSGAGAGPCEGGQYRHDPMLIGLDWPAEEINRRINLRVKAMFFPDKAPVELAEAIGPRGESVVEETRRLEAAGVLGPQAREALGYKQVLQYLRGELTMEGAFERTKILTRRFAKTQRTWLKRFRGVRWLAAAGRPTDELAQEALRVMAAEKSGG